MLALAEPPGCSSGETTCQGKLTPTCMQGSPRSPQQLLVEPGSGAPTLYRWARYRAGCSGGGGVEAGGLGLVGVEDHLFHVGG